MTVFKIFEMPIKKETTGTADARMEAQLAHLSAALGPLISRKVFQ